MTNEHNEEAVQEDGFAPILYTFANRSPAPELEHLLSMFYQAAISNSVGVMQALNSETNEEEVVLVGVAINAEGKAQCFPIAKVLAAEDVGKYRAPDGKGGYFNPASEEESKAVQDEMKPVDESLIDIPVE